MTVVEHPLAREIRDHGVLLTRIARRLCGNRFDADDLVHDTYERALRGWNHYVDRGNSRSWMVTILYHRFIDRCRKTRRLPRTEALEDLELAAPEPGGPPEWSTLTPRQVESALATIGAEFRQVYELRLNGRTYDEIAAELNIPKATVGTRLIRARRKLKDAVLRELEGGRADLRSRRPRTPGHAADRAASR